MNDIQIFQNNQFGQIRVATTDTGEPLFAATDVCQILGYSNPRDAIAKHCKSRGVAKCDTPINGVIQSLTYINEANLYRLVLKSNMPDAERVQDWVCEDILVTIRRTGGYLIAKSDETPEQIMARALVVAQETIKRAEAEKERLAEQNRLANEQIKQSAPKVQYYNEVLMSSDTYTTTQIAKELGMGAPTLNEKLKRLGVQYKQHGQWLLMHQHQDKGYTKTNPHTFTHSDGTQGTAMSTVWTEKGRLFIHNLLSS